MDNLYRKSTPIYAYVMSRLTERLNVIEVDLLSPSGRDDDISRVIRCMRTGGFPGVSMIVMSIY